MRGTTRSAQQGVALFVALMLLVVLALMGVSAMRMSMFNARIATGAQLSAMTFQAAESSLASTYGEVTDTNSPMLLNLLDGASVRLCQQAATPDSSVPRRPGLTLEACCKLSPARYRPAFPLTCHFLRGLSSTASNYWCRTGWRWRQWARRRTSRSPVTMFKNST